jgi:3-oxoadipate enol-lactonase
MAFVKTTHGKVHYQMKGSGPCVVLVRGLGRWSVHWNGWDDRLAKTCTVVTFDHKGLGQTTSPMRLWDTLKSLADDIQTILRHERIESAHIVGTSLGGMVAAEFALHHPNMTESITMIGSSVGRSGHFRLSTRAAKLILVSPIKKLAAYDELAELLTAPKTSKEIKEQLARDWREEDTKVKQPLSTVIAQLVAALRFRNWERLQNISCPALIVVGRQDQFVPRGNSLFLHEKMPGSQFVEVEDAGHEPHVDQPEVLTQVVSEFVLNHDPMSRT